MKPCHLGTVVIPHKMNQASIALELFFKVVIENLRLIRRLLTIKLLTQTVQECYETQNDSTE